MRVPAPRVAACWLLRGGLLAAGSACALPPRDGAVGVADPAAAYCVALGHVTSFEETPGGTRVLCRVSAERTCEAWAFYRGDCAPELGICARLGYRLAIVEGRDDPFSARYAVCIDAEGKVAGSAAELSGVRGRQAGGTGKRGGP